MTAIPCAFDATHPAGQYSSPFGPICPECYSKRKAGGLEGPITYAHPADTGERLRGGALPWNWCYGNQPVHVPGSVYADSDESRHLVKMLSENEAQHEHLAGAMYDVPADGNLSRTAIRRHLRKGRGR